MGICLGNTSIIKGWHVGLLRGSCPINRTLGEAGTKQQSRRRAEICRALGGELNPETISLPLGRDPKRSTLHLKHTERGEAEGQQEEEESFLV